MRKWIFFIMIGLISLSLTTFAQEIYRWVDEKGTIHFADDMSLVPEKYRDKAQKKALPKPDPSPPRETREDASDETPPQKTDRTGRGEEWWRARAKECHDQLLEAKKNHESAQAELRSKEKELEESTFKPKSLKRKLNAEIKGLEAKVKEWERKRAEAENVLEKVLPKEAEEYGADPDWIQIKESMQN